MTFSGTTDPVPLGIWQARVLLVMTLEPQTVKDITDRLATRGALLDPSRVRFVLEELKDLGLLDHAPQVGRAGSQYWLGSGPRVERALDDAYVVVRSSSPRKK